MKNNFQTISIIGVEDNVPLFGEKARKVFVDNLHFLMDAQGKSQKDICERLEVSSATASDWCTGKKYPRIDKMQQLAEMFGVSLTTLVSEKGVEDYEDMKRLEALHQNPQLGILFDHTRKMKKEDVDFMIQMAERMIKEQEGG